MTDNIDDDAGEQLALLVLVGAFLWSSISSTCHISTGYGSPYHFVVGLGVGCIRTRLGWVLSRGRRVTLTLAHSALRTTEQHSNIQRSKLLRTPSALISATVRTAMAPLTTASDEKTHQALLDRLDIHAVHKPFRNPNWKPAQRRNKNLKQIIGEASRKEASVMATQNNSGISTPAEGTPSTTNIAQAAQSLSTLVLEKNGRAAAAGNGTGPAPTYTNIESAPSFHPSSQKKYCDITGLPAPYTDPKTRLRYHNKELYGTIRTMPQNVYEAYLAARGAHTILK